MPCRIGRSCLDGDAIALAAGAKRKRRSEDTGDHWGPRTLDLDLLLYGDAVIALPGLSVPHPRLHQRAFALVPLLELDPGIVIPRVGNAADALAGVDRAGIEALG